MTHPLEIDNVSKSYGKIEALKNVSFSIREGEIFGLLGPNGAGKTTTIASIVTLETPTGGSIRIFGSDNRDAPQLAKQNLGFVPQELIHHGYFTVQAILRFHARYYGIYRIEAHMAHLLKQLELWNHRNKLVNQLSGGMKRRLLIAKALIHKPKLLLLDEPTAGVDVSLRTSLWKLIRKLRDNNLSILLTTHYLEEAEMLCDRIGILNHGTLHIVEETQKLIASLSQREVRILLHTKAEPIDHPKLRAQSDKLIKFALPANYTLGRLLSELKLPLGAIEDIHIREGNLEDAFQQIIGASE